MNGMDDTADEHNFSDDDDFQNLPDDALRELETNAILSTQQAKPETVSRQNALNRPVLTARASATRNNVLPHLQNAIVDNFETDTFETVGEERAHTPVEDVRQPTRRQYQPPSEVTQREQWRQNRFGKPNPPTRPPIPQRQQNAVYQQPQALPPPNRDSNGASRTFGNTQGSLYAGTVPGPQKGSDQDALKARIEELLKERDGLFTELKETKGQVMTQKGEIAIIRENREKETKVYDRQLAAVKKSMQEESTKHGNTIDSLTSKHNALITELNMTKDDLKEETRRIKSLESRLKEKTGDRPAGPAITPEKQRPANSLRDGFDDDEIMVISPAKSASRRSKPATPTAANKRKRKVDPSPIKPLVLRQSDDATSDPKHEQPSNGNRIVPVIRRDRQAQRHLKLIQKILNYQPKAHEDRLIESMMQYAFPSEPTKTFSATILNSTAQLQGPSLPTDLIQIFIDLWSRSLKEKYYDGLALVMEVVDHITDVQTSVVDKTIISNLLTVIQDSATINGSARFKHSPVYRGNFGQFRQTPASALNSLVSSTACLSLLYKLACLSVDSEALIDHFWRSMSTDFVLMMLNSWQPLSDITLMLHLLATSIFPASFGNICADPSTQNTMETHIINRVSYLLWETPKVDEGLPNPSRSDLCRFRLEALDLLSTLAIDSSLPPHDDPRHHGSILLASHPSALARIVRSLYDATAGLYLLTSSSPLYAQIINRGVRLLYHLMTQHGEEIDLQQKLSAVNGGVHKHRVVLTRLAFSEGWFIDSDVTDETCARATAMLEDSVTPDEAEMMIQAFPGFSGRKREPAQNSVQTVDSMETVS